MLWFNSQVLVFGSWEEREHGPSHSLGNEVHAQLGCLDLAILC